MILDKLLTDPEDIKTKVLNSVERGESLLLTYFNQHCLNIYFEDESYKKLLNTKYVVYQADLGVFLSLKLLGRKEIERIDATTMNNLILIELIKNKIPITIVGGKFDEKFIKNESEKRKINLINYQNGFFRDAQTENVIEYLNNTIGRVFIIGMGVPQQEIFAEKLSRISNSKVIICVGNFLEFYFGTKKRAPVFIQRIGLEWLFRLVTEPARLWRRYLIGIPVFLFNVIKEYFGLHK